MMDQELKQKWIDALRSGKYKQGQRLLRDVDDTYCCLGVLIDVADPEGWGYTMTENTTDSAVGWHYKGDQCLLRLGREGVLERVFSDFIMSSLVSMNDYGRSFTEIAMWIEDNV